MAKENLNELIVGMHNREVERIREAQKKEEEQRQEQDQQRRKKTKGALSLFEQVTNPVLPEEKIFQAARKAELTRAQREEQQAAQQLEDYKQSGRRSADWDKAVSDAMAAINPGMGNLDLQLMQAASNTRNQTEDYYQAVADYFTRNRQATEDRHLMENDVADVEAMSAEDRKLLETYAYGRSEWMDPKKVADSTAARAELEKKYGAKRVEELAESWQRHQNQLLAERNRQETQAQAGNGFFAGAGHSAASVAANALGSLSAPLGYLQEAMGRTGRYQTLDPNNPGALPGQYASAVRETVSEDMGGVGKVLYHGTMGAADNLARIAMAAGSGPLALGLAAVGSFGSTVSEASSRGATPGQAVLLGVANAGIEVATEKIGLDELFRAGKSGYKGAKAAFMQALRQGGIEAAEEELSFLGNILTDAAVMQEKSAYNQQIGELVANGMSYADAKNQANRALWDEAVNTAFTSFVSGGVMSGAQSGGQYAGQKIQERNATRNATVPENATVSKAETVGAENPAVSKTETTTPAPERVPQESTAKDGMARVMEAAREVMGVDTAPNARYNQNNIGNINGGTNYGAGLSETDAAGLSGRAGARQNGGYNGAAIRGGIPESAGMEAAARVGRAGLQAESGAGSDALHLRNSGILRISEELQNARNRKGVQSYDLYDTSASAQEYEQALTAGRNSDAANGWCVTPKSAQELAEGNVRTVMNANKTVGVGVAPDGDIVAVFKNKRGGPKRALDTAMPAAIEMGGDRLDCYGEGLVSVYEDYGFVPVARVEFNPEYANDGWTPDKGMPYIYVMMHNGDSASTVTEKMRTYKKSTMAELNALPTYGKDGYDDAMAYRDSLFANRGARSGSVDSYRGTAIESGGGAVQVGDVKIGSGAAEVGMDHGAVGAAERGFSPKYELIDQYGNIPEGENPVRPDQLPRSVTGEDRVSYTARTALEAEATPDEFAELIENETVRGGFSYIPISNSETTQQAMAEISEAGWERSRGAWEQQVRNGQTGAAMIATGALLYNHAVNSGDYRAAMDILMDYQQAARNAGQAVQAARILKTLSPENRLYMIQTSVRRMVEDMHLDREITIDENLARQYQQAYDPQEADHILDLIAKDVAQQLPSNWRERFTALRYLNMLGNFRTQVRNWVGNVTNQGLYMAKDQLAATIEGLANAASGGQFERTKVNFTDRATRRAAAADYENVADWISGGGRTNDRMDASTDFARRVQENRRIFRFAPLEGYRKATDWAMNNRYFGDAAFGRANYARALAGYLNARGIKTDNLDTVSPEVLNAAREYAVRQAQEATFRDNNQVSEFVSGALRGKNTPAWAQVIGEAVMPFRKTPANVLVRAEEFSPLGLINSAVNTVQAAKGNITGAELVDSWAKSITGTGLFAIGWALANMGYLRGGPDEDEEKAEFDKLNGMQDYALVLPGGGNFTIDAFSPTALPLLLGAQLDKVLDGTELTFADLEGVMHTLSDPMIEMSMLSGLNDTIDAIRYADNSLGQFLVNAGFNYLTQALGNTLLGQVERSTEESRMTTYTDKDSQIPAWLQRNLGKLSQKIPGWDYNQTEYIDQWGREQKNPEGIKNWLYNLLSPSYIDKVEVDAVAEELYRLHKVTGENVFPQSPETTITYTDKDGNRHEKYNLSADEADKLKRVQGQTHAKLVADLVGDEDFKKLTDAQKAKAAILCRDYARELARVEVLPGYDGMAAWMDGIQGNAAAAIMQKVATSEFSGAFDDLTKAWKTGKEDAELAEGLEAAYQAFSGLSEEARATAMEQLPQKVKDYISAREAGQDAADYLKVQKAVTQADHYMDQMAEALKKGGTGEEHFDALDQLYESYAKMDYNDREAVKEKASSKVKYFLEARAAGVPTQTFSGLYNEFNRIQGAEDVAASDKATQWAHALQKAREAGRITQTQADKLREAMGMWQVIPAKADAYANLTGEGLSADDADNLLRILDQIQGTGKLDEDTGQRAITDLDRLQGIAGASFLTSQERDAAMKLYMPDYDPKDESPNKTELKYDYARQELGLTAAEYVAAYRAHVENSRKQAKMDAWEKLGFTAQEAAMLWRLFGASGSAKIDVEAWYNEK